MIQFVQKEFGNTVQVRKTGDVYKRQSPGRLDGYKLLRKEYVRRTEIPEFEKKWCFVLPFLIHGA